jgi:hypothetical protein
MDREIEFSLRVDDELTAYGITHREKLIGRIECMHDKVVKFRGSNSRYASIINDLTFSLSLWLDGYEMDAEDPEKLRGLLCTACGMIGKPRTMEELVKMLRLNMDGTPIIDGNSE